MTTGIKEKPSRFTHPEGRTEWRSPRQIEIDQAVASWTDETGAHEHAEMAREMWDKANQSAQCIQNALGAIDHHDRQVLTVVIAHRTLRETLRATLIAMGVSHHHETDIQSLIDEVSGKTSFQPVSDIDLLKLCPDARPVFFTPEHDPELTAQQAIQDARALTDIMRDILAR